MKSVVAKPKTSGSSVLRLAIWFPKTTEKSAFLSDLPRLRVFPRFLEPRIAQADSMCRLSLARHKK